jgi:alginate O-acetyltransferase complex protein AlgI
MLFNSLVFLYAFLPVTYLVFWRLKTREDRWVWLTLTGYVFYAAWDYRFTALMATSTIVAYLAGLGFRRWTDAPRRRLLLIAPITVDLSLLGFFKYAGFGLETANRIAGWLDLPLHLSGPNIILPVGISFYTFHTITYIVDAYRGTIVPTRNFFEFSCYVSLFSQLVAGPIVRFRQIEEDLERIDLHRPAEGWNVGWSFFTIGMIKKVLIADTIAAIIDPALATAESLSTPAAWLCMLGYAYQIYFDFSGYSDMAVGLGHLFGLRIPQNFHSPYQATDPQDFWRRWHISLSTVLRDYLYIPLGGNRGGRARTYRNILLTMLLGGLWHGANWTFVVWGAYHGLLILCYRIVRPSWDALPTRFRQGAMFFLVLIGWVPFRAPTWAVADTLLGAMFSWTQAPAPAGWMGLSLMLAVAAMVAHGTRNTWELSHRWHPWSSAGLAMLFAAAMLVMYAGHHTPFLYFQF